MAKLKTNAVISGLSGQLGKDHYARYTKDGKTIISAKPDFSNRQFSEGQYEAQSRLTAAAAYARVACKLNPIYAEKAEGTSRNAYNLAVGDWFNGPVIRLIEWEDGCIDVLADDDVLVTKVTVAILDEQGQCLEQADARPDSRVWWKYQAAHTGRIRVEAWDLPGNVTRQEFTPSGSEDSWRKSDSRRTGR